MKQKSAKGTRIVRFGLLGALAVLLIVLGVYAYMTWPVYPSFEKEVASLSELRAILDECDATRGLVVVDLTEFGADSQTWIVDLDGRTRCAKPYCYHVTGKNAGKDGFYTLGVSGNTRGSREGYDGTSYRDVPIKLNLREDLSPRKGVELELDCGAYAYSIGGSFDTAGLSAQEISEREASLQEMLFAAADRIIDGKKSE